MRILKAQVEQAARALGNIFIPILNAVLPYLIAAAKVIRILANAIASLVGFTMPEMDYSSLGNISAGAGEIGEEFDNAAGSAAKLKKTLLGIDELNVMPEASSGGGADVGGVGGGGFDFELPTYDFIGDAVSGRIDEIVEKMKEWLGLTGEINSWSDLFDTRLGKILKAVGLIGAALAAWKIGVGVNSLIELIKGSGIVKFIGDVAFAIKAVSAGAATIGEAIAYVFGGAPGIISGVAVGILGLIGYIKNLISMIREGESVSNVLGAALGALGTAAGGFLIAIGVGATVATGGIVAAVVAGVAAIGMLIAVVTNHWDEIVVWFSDVCDKIGQFFVDLRDGIVTVWNAVGTWFNTNVILPMIGFFRNLWTSVSGFFVNLWTDIVAIYFAIPGWFDTNVVQPIVNFFVGLWTSISNAASVCWNAIVSFFSPAVTWFSKLFGSILQTISDIFYNIGVIASGCWQIIVAVWGIVSQWFNSNVVQPVGQFFTNLWISIRTTAINAWNGIKSVFATIGSWINQYVIQPVSTFFTNLWTKVRTLATTAWATTQTVAINAWNGIKSVYATVTSWINTTIVQPVGTFFKNLWSGFLTGAKNAWSGVKSVFGQVASFFESTFKKAWSGVVKVFSVAGNIFVNIKNGIVTAFKSVVNGLIRGINNVVAVPFNAINNALYTLKNISILGLTPFSGIRTISIPSIPYLAQGGVVDAGQLFVANERGPELVANAGRKTAVMNNDQIVESVSRGVYQAVVSAMGSSRGDQVVEAKVNDKVLFEVLVSRARQETVRTGHNPLLGGA
jgi:phage-related protein